MADYHYPKIDEKMLRLISNIYENNPGYFTDPSCPYEQSTKDIFQKTAKHHDFDSHAPNELKSSDGLLEEINLLSSQLKSYWNEIQSGQGTTPADKNTYFRLATTLIEKQIDMKERVLNIKEYEAFVMMVLDVIDRELDADQRARVLDKFKTVAAPLTEDNKPAITGNTTRNETGEDNATQ